jgi:hypothetical protein
MIDMHQCKGLPAQTRIGERNKACGHRLGGGEEIKAEAWGKGG